MMRLDQSDMFGNRCIACEQKSGIKTIIIKNEAQYAPAITLCSECRKKLGELLLKDGDSDAK